MLINKHILVGVCGSIAAYKSALLVRLLVKAGADVRVIMTPDAAAFITPLTLSTLSKHPVLTNLVKNNEGEWNNHVDLGLWADALVIAPATANTLGKFANGICDNLLTAVYLSARCQVYIAPAMDLDMLAHSSTKQNIQKLISFGNTIIEPGFGELASGLVGEGRLAEPEEIVSFLADKMAQSADLMGKRVLITAGPTYEAIDPVRFIGNHSSGKMGFALAAAAAKRGASVVLVAGPTSLVPSHPNIHLIPVVSAEEMFTACVGEYGNCDLAIMSAAVADYTPEHVAASKIKKQEDTFTISLTKTKDILKELGSRKKAGQVLIGFALETDNELTNAQKKLVGKNADLIVLNSLKDTGAGFGTDTNKVSLLSANGDIQHLELMAKNMVANHILTAAVKLL